MKKEFRDICAMNWIQRWAGSYTFISCAFWGFQYSSVLKQILGNGLGKTIFIHRAGTVSFFVEQNEFTEFGNFLAGKVNQDESIVGSLLAELKENTDKIMAVMDELGGKIPTYDEYLKFRGLFENHLAYHNFMKKTVEFLPAEVLEKNIAQFKEARVYSEPVYSRTESFFRELAGLMANKENYDKNILTCLLQEEFEQYITTAELPLKKVLQDRYNASALIFNGGKLRLITGSAVDDLEDCLVDTVASNQVTGTVAYEGNVSGVCRIILDPHNVVEFNDGDILIAGMTRPEYLPLVKKASAIITDVGGMLCHAAIIARELKKPCIIGTENATKIFTDGELLILDTKKGEVKKIAE